MKFIKYLLIIPGLLNLHIEADAKDQNSTCYGQTHSGSIKNAVQLPAAGANYKVFSQLAWYLGRTYVHSQVSTVMLNSYAELQQAYPSALFMYAETGWPHGGAFKPHKTHQNGLSVDFMVPVTNENRLPVYLPVGIKNRWGYDFEFNQAGEMENYSIDFDLMSSHLKSLSELADKSGFKLKKIYFDPLLQAHLFAAKHGTWVKQNLTFNSNQAWVRHDEHYHVDFAVKCEK
ncbi:MAG: penicillin-insensitive murein endopeptidase [Marinicella sp.]